MQLISHTATRNGTKLDHGSGTALGPRELSAPNDMDIRVAAAMDQANDSKGPLLFWATTSIIIGWAVMPSLFSGVAGCSSNDHKSMAGERLVPPRMTRP